MRDAVQCVEITIRGDNVVEGVEAFDITFSSDDPRDQITSNTTTVLIMDDDGTY